MDARGYGRGSDILVSSVGALMNFLISCTIRLIGPRKMGSLPSSRRGAADAGTLRDTTSVKTANALKRRRIDPPVGARRTRPGRVGLEGALTHSVTAMRLLLPPGSEKNI